MSQGGNSVLRKTSSFAALLSIAVHTPVKWQLIINQSPWARTSLGLELKTHRWWFFFICVTC